MHSSLSIIKETGKEGSNDVESSQRPMHLFNAIGPLIHVGSPLRPPATYPANWPKFDAPAGYHTRVNLLGGMIPQELFDYILIHIEPGTQTHLSVFTKGPLFMRGLRSLALVCRHWANKCRRYIFGGAVLMISSSDEMDEILEYAFHGCPLLIPIHKIIKGIHVVQVYDATRSFFHLLQILKKADVPVQILDLRPLLPPRIPWVQIPSKTPCPRWSIPPKVATPPSLLSGCCAVTVKSIDMESFSQVLQLIRHFALVPMKSWENENRGDVDGSVRYDRLTWSHRINSPVYRKPVLCRRPYIPNCVHIEAQYCTDNVRLCIYTAVARPTFAMHWMQEDERRWMFSFVVSLDQFFDLEDAGYCVLHSNFFNLEDHQWPRIYWHLDVMPHGIGERSYEELELAFHLDRLPQDAPALSVRVVGLEVVVPWEFREWPCPIDFSALLAMIRSCPTRLIINFRFPSLMGEELQEYLEKHRPFNWNLQTEAHTILFTCRFERSKVWSRMDPVTLNLTGQTWQRHEDIIPSLVSEQSQDDDHVF